MNAVDGQLNTVPVHGRWSRSRTLLFTARQMPQVTEPTIDVRGRARTVVEPDRLVLTFDVESGGERASDARARAADRRRTLVDAVSEVAPAVSVDVTRTNVGETCEMFDASADADYAASTTVEAGCRPEQFDDVAQAGSDVGASLESVTPILAEPHRESVRRELAETATERARGQADRAAAAADHAVGALVELDVGDTDPFDAIDDEFAVDVPAEHVLGPVDVTVTVDATYALEPADASR